MDIKQKLIVKSPKVMSDLGGVTNGNSGVVLISVGYMHFNGTPYVKPVYPRTLVIVAGTTHHNTNRLRKDN